MRSLILFLLNMYNFTFEIVKSNINHKKYMKYYGYLITQSELKNHTIKLYTTYISSIIPAS